jgi:hypothetical protein
MRIVVYAFDGITMFHLAAPLLVFGEVGRQGLAAGWDPVVWTQDGRGIRTIEGPRVDDVAAPTRSMTPTWWCCRPGRPTCPPPMRR